MCKESITLTRYNGARVLVFVYRSVHDTDPIFLDVEYFRWEPGQPTCPNTANGNTDGEYPSPHLRFFLLTPVPSTGWYFYFWRPKKRNLSVDVGEGKLLWQILYIGWFYYVCEWQFILFSHFWFSFFSLSISCHPILPCGCQLICVFKPKGYNNY